MGTTIHEIYIVSNVEQKLARMAAVHQAYDATVAKTAATEQAAHAATQYRAGATDVLTAKQMVLKRATDDLNNSTLRAILINRVFSTSSHTAGLNVGMLSLRISEGLIPVLLMGATAMLPVIAGLLAIASAAVAATLGLGGLMAIGLYKWSKDFGGENMGYAGARRPFQSNTRQTNFWSEVFKPFADSLNDPAIKGKIDTAVAWTKEVFQKDLPNAFAAFVQTLAEGDFAAIRTTMDMFRKWLPEASVGLARWGQDFLNLIGPQSLTRMNNFFKYLAGGLMNVARYLADGGFEDFDSFFGILGRFLSKLMELGKSVLPILVHQLEQIYPNPLEPVIDSLIDLFTAIRESDNAMEVVGNVTQLLAAMLIFSTAMKMLGMVFTLGKAIAWGVLALGIYWGIRSILAGIVQVAMFIVTVIYDAVALLYNGFAWAAEQLYKLTGLDYRVPEMEYYNPFDSISGLNGGRVEFLGKDYTDSIIPSVERDALMRNYAGAVELAGRTGESVVRIFVDENWNLAAQVENEANSTIGTSRRSNVSAGRGSWG